jgi:hypothetical protein
MIRDDQGAVVVEDRGIAGDRDTEQHSHQCPEHRSGERVSESYHAGCHHPWVMLDTHIKLRARSVNSDAIMSSSLPNV